MSDQRRFRQEARQGFMQFALHLYDSYKEEHGDDGAKQFVADQILEIFKEFSGEGTSDQLATEKIEKRIEAYQQRVAKASDEHEAMVLFEYIDNLNYALKILERDEGSL